MVYTIVLLIKIKRNITVELESLATSLDKFVDQSLKELFTEFLRSSTNILVKNIYNDKDSTFKSLNSLFTVIKILLSSHLIVYLQW